jgi:transcriptional regulator with XRE-family HTH domain
MKERIIKIMENENLSPARFAEAIGAQRATLSHILSGRNNVSLEITMKILQCFPKISSDWLLRGVGNMCTNTKGQLPEPDLFGSPASVREDNKTLHEYRKKNEPGKPPISITKLPSVETAAQPEKPVRNVTKIMIFYSDNTFDTFISEKNDKD